MARFTNGWIKLWRSAWESDLSENLYLWSLWNWLLFAAHWKPSSILWEGTRRDIPAGVVVLGIKELADRWNCSQSTIKKWLVYLQKSGRISLETSPRGTLVTILNWSVYQSPYAERQEQGENNAGTKREQGENNAGLIEEGKKERREEERERDPLSQDQISECEATWGKTLQRYGIDKKPEEDRQQIARLIQRHGFDKTCRALLGAGFEEKSDNYDPAKHVTIYRLAQNPALFDKFANLGAKAAKTTQAEPKTRKWGA